MVNDGMRGKLRRRKGGGQIGKLTEEGEEVDEIEIKKNKSNITRKKKIRKEKKRKNEGKRYK